MRETQRKEELDIFMSELDLPATRAQIPAVQIFKGGLLAEESYGIPVSVVVLENWDISLLLVWAV